MCIRDSIISVLNKRKYVKKDGKYMVPTEVSYKITDMLMQLSLIHISTG